jgi:quercetin dioxygenase-like cupin family protein
MNITPRTQALTNLTPMEVAHFTGKAGSRTLLAASDPGLSTVAAVVRFEAGVRNYWHSHAGGQLLHVIEGEGWVQARGADARRIRVGDTAATDPNEEHWHGAGRSGPFAHIVVNIGETRWLEESPEPPE